MNGYENRLKISGHRGYPAKEIENTKKGILMAIDENLDYVECDVRKTKDNIPVIFHDHKISRLINGTGKLKSLSFEKVKMLKYKDGQKVLTLKELLKLTKGKIRLILDVKSRRLERIVLDLIATYQMKNEIIIQSHLGKIIRDFHQLDSSYNYCLYRAFIGKYLFPRRWFSKKMYHRLVGRYPIKYLSLDGPFMYDRFIQYAHKDGIKIILGAMKLDNYLNKIDKWKVSIINCNNPAKIREELKKL